MEINAFLEVARELASRAADRLMELRQAPLTESRKSDHSLVTNADQASDRLIREGLRAAFPSHGILTEENGYEGAVEAEWVWVVDPLDGTKAYAKQLPGFSVMIGLLRRSVPVAGVVADPLEGRIYEAVKGQGAFHTFEGQRQRVRCSIRSEWEAMPVVVSTGFPSSASAALQPTLIGPWLSPINSVGIKVGYLVRQAADIYINHHGVHLWDTCAPQVILEEAGGRISLVNGEPLSYSLGGNYRHPGATLATNGKRHEELLKHLGGIKPLLS